MTWAGTFPSRPGTSELQPARSWTLPDMEHPQLIWAIWSSALSPSQWWISSWISPEKAHCEGRVWSIGYSRAGVGHWASSAWEEEGMERTCSCPQMPGQREQRKWTLTLPSGEHQQDDIHSTWPGTWEIPLCIRKNHVRDQEWKQSQESVWSHYPGETKIWLDKSLSSLIWLDLLQTVT